MDERLIVSPRSNQDLSDFSIQVRHAAKSLGCITGHKLDAVGLLEALAARLPDKLMFDVVEAHELPTTDHEGLTKPTGEVLLREDVYEGACDGNGRDVFTVIHELVHWFLHRKDFGMARADAEFKFYTSPEWQANRAASFILMPIEAARECLSDPEKLSDLCGVSLEAAVVRLNILAEKNL